MKQLDYGAEACENRAVQFVWGVLVLALMLFAGRTIAAVEVVGGELGADDSEVMIEPIEPLSAAELDELVGPVALYPDDLLSIALAASTYPLQVVQASRFLEERNQNPDLQPDAEWDDSVVALLNYPEALALLNDDLDWTWKLGEAVLAQQEDVLAAVADFRERARVAGNLESDERQVVEVVDDGAIEIKPADPEVIYVPYYEPSRVTVYHDYPVYHYYPRAYPVYYYPYPAGYRFSAGYFWGVTSAFSIGWSSHRLHLHHHAFHGHPYYGRTYYDHYYYRRPHLSLTYNYYRDYSRYRHSARRHHAGNYWRPRTVYYGSSPRHAYRRWAYRDGYRHHLRSHQDRRDRRDYRDRRDHRDHREHRAGRDRHFAHDNAARNRHRDADHRRRDRGDDHRRDRGDDHRRDRSDRDRPDSGEQRSHRERRRSDSDSRHGDGQRQPLVADSGRRRDAAAGGQRPAAQAPQRGSMRTVQPQGRGRAATSLTRVQRENLRVLTNGNIRTVTPQRAATGGRSDVAPRRNRESLDSRIANNRGRAPQATQASRPTPAKVRRSAPVRVQRAAANKVQRTASNEMRRTTPTTIQRAAANKAHRTAPRTAPQPAERRVATRARTAPARAQAGSSMQARAQRQAQAYAKRAAPARSPRAQSQRRSAPKAQSRGTSMRQSAGNRSGKRISFAGK